MTLNADLSQRSGNRCELCDDAPAELHAFTVAPKEGTRPDEQVVLCDVCVENIPDPASNADHWRCLTGAVWSEVPAVQALSYKILTALPGEEWATETLQSVDFGEDIVTWAVGVGGSENVVHKDAFGNELAAGDNVLLTQNLNVKGANFIAPKGTLVKKIRLVADNAEQIEGKINGDTIVILTKFVKKQA